MESNLPGFQKQDHAAPQRMLSRGRLISLFILSGLLAVCFIFSLTTRDAMAHLSFLKGQQLRGGSEQTTVVDLHPWQIAQALAPLAVSKEEEEHAHEAERLADHEVTQG